MNKLKILHISRPDNEGAGSFVFDIHNFINSQEEYDSKLITYYIKDKSKSNVISYKTEIGNNISILKRKVINKITKIMISLKLLRKGKIDSNYSPQSITQINNWEKGLKVLKKTKFKPDIILVYFIDNFLNIKELYNIYQATKAKFFFIMPDMALMTGGCHYAWDCEKYQNNCGNCPAIYSNTANDLSRKVYQYKKKIFNMFPFGVITGTEWLFEQAQHSSLLSNKKIKKILIPINENVFSPKDRKSCKEYFYLPVNKIIIFIGAQSLKNKRKGFNYLIDSLSILKKKYKVKDIDIFLLIACKNFEESIEIPFKYRYVGLLDLKKELLLAFNAADLFVCPSVEDSGPMMINQAILSGCPVIAFKMGAAIDLILDGETGYIAELKDSNDLAECMYKFLKLSDKEKDYLRKTARDIGLQRTSIKSQMPKLMKIINK